ILIDRIPYKDIDNRVIGLICFALDITELEKAETEKRELEAQLQHTQRIEAIGTLAGGIAHNFNNLLMGILGNISLMLMESDVVHPHYKYMKIVEKLVQDGSELTSQLLGYAREGRFEIKPVSLNALVEETSKTFGLTKKEITVHHDLAEDLFPVKVDQGQIKQVLLNLYVNAADALPLGGDIFLRTKNTSHQDIQGMPYRPKPGKYVLLTVKDTGTGMDRETMERIFEPFFTTKGLAKGTGLGLASAYGIIKAHGGYIDVDSKKGQWTIFSIHLPATEEPVDNKDKIDDGFFKGRETILLVDDEDEIIDMGERVLNRLGYHVLKAKSGRQALEIYQKNQGRIDMVLLDMIMPDMGGGETYDRLKKIHCGIKVLLSSGYSVDGQAQEILDRGCSGFIQKPFSIHNLSQKIRDIL
ncbi:MAG: response regulator, partial [Pseudomonadota bacterium]